MLEGAKVAVVPGAVFGVEGFVRLSYATSRQNIVSGMSRIRSLLERGN